MAYKITELRKQRLMILKHPANMSQCEIK